MKKAKVVILMSTYNGDKYIKQQITSIINQNYTFWDLYIRDDGSSDNTIKIIETYIKKDKRIHLVKDSKLHRGVKDSFIWLLRSVSSDYYMFCDQDDFWMPNKITESLYAINNITENIPAVACCDLFLVDKDLNILHDSMWHAHYLNKMVYNPKSIRIASMFPGCTMIFNELAKFYTLSSNYNFPMHDIQISMSVASHDGKIIPINKPLIKYRLHGNNVVGLYSGNNWFFDKIAHLLRFLKDNKAYFKVSRDILGTSLSEFLYLKIKHLLCRLL